MPSRKKGWLVRGESLVASGGIALAAILLAVTAGSAWWTLHTHRKSMETARRDQVRAVTTLLAASAEPLLASGEVMAVRRLLSSAAAENALETCRITLPDGSLIADMEPGVAVLSQLPDRWDGPTQSVPESLDSREFAVGIVVPGRGEALIRSSVGAAPAAAARWEAQAGIGAIGACGLIALWVVYRNTRSRLGALGAIGDALTAADAGETEASALRISDGYGPTAAAWNRLLDEREALRARTPEAAGPTGVRRGGEEVLYSACDAMSQGLLLVDERMVVKYANGAAANFLGLKREALIGSEVVDQMGDPAVTRAVRGIAGGQSRQRATVEVKQQGERGDWVLRFSIRPVRRDDSAAAMVLIEDVTQQRVADEARNAFVAQATHELRTPLTNISLYVETLVDDGEADAATRARCLNVIGQEVKRLERIVSDMLSVSQIEAGSLRLSADDVRLDAMFEEIESDYIAQAQDKELGLTFSLPPKLPVIHGDRDKIVLAIHNLIGNALKYTPSGGQVKVVVEEAGGRLQVAVSDNGIGISEAECELIFEKFYRARDKRLASITGSGLGLALARQVARMHGGDITVRSQIDKGSTFTMTLPVGPLPAAAMRAAA